MHVAAARAIKGLMLLILIGAIGMQGFVPESACSLRCRATGSRSCCPKPSGQTPRMPCCGTMTRPPATALLAPATVLPVVDASSVLLPATEPPRLAPALIAARTATPRDAGRFATSPPDVLRI